MDPHIQHELAKLDPAVPFRASRSHLHHTWAKTFYSHPELYIQPESVAEIQKLVTLARRCRRRIVTVGSVHSPSDLTCTSSWVVNLDNFRRILSLDKESGLVTVEAGIRLSQLGEELEKHGLTLPNLGSIDSQSVAGVISTGTHGSSLRYGLLSESVRALSLVLANGQVVRCSATNNPSLFRAALLSLGAIGIISEMTLQTVPSFNIASHQCLQTLSYVLDNWSKDLWKSSEFTRIWWMPYQKTAIIWRANTTDRPLKDPPGSFLGGLIGYYTYHNMLALANYIPRLLPWIEWFVFGMNYGFKPGKVVTTAVQPARTGLLMDCLYSQFVNEWALPLEKGQEAITRLSAWLNGDTETAQIPFSPKGVWVHCPIEVRVSDTSISTTPRPFLDPTNPKGPTLFLNATLYRPYLRDPPSKDRYYEAFEWLMRELGGRPHWAKNFTSTTAQKELHDLYGEDLDEWLRVRNAADLDGMFLGEWHLRNIMRPTTSAPPAKEGATSHSMSFPLLEREEGRRKFGKRGTGDGLEWIGARPWLISAIHSDEKGASASSSPPSPPMTATSEESFDHLAHGEASVLLSSQPGS